MLSRFFPDPVPDAKTAMARAEVGARFLDKSIGPDWYNLIDAGQLDISSPRNCILGQLIRAGHFRMLFVGLSDGLDYGLSCGLWDVWVLFQPPWVSRSFRRLTRAWKTVLKNRHAAGRVTRAEPKTLASSKRTAAGNDRFVCG